MIYPLIIALDLVHLVANDNCTAKFLCSVPFLFPPRRYHPALLQPVTPCSNCNNLVLLRGALSFRHSKVNKSCAGRGGAKRN